MSESTRLLCNRIQKVEPEYVKKIVGYLLLQDRSEEELAQLACGPDSLIQEVIHKAKADLQRISNKPALSPISPPRNVDTVPVSEVTSQYTPFSEAWSPSPAAFRVPASYWDQQLNNQRNLDSTPITPLAFSNIVNGLQNQIQMVSMENKDESLSSVPPRHCYREAQLSSLHTRTGRRFSCAPEFPKTCYYYSRGNCKHGSNCRYSHQEVLPDSTFSPNRSDFANGDQVLSPDSLHQLECEIVEILKSNRGGPISIAALPTLYFDKYGKVIQAEGYLTESQRHGKAGYSLTRLLARLRNSIRLIDRPHGQHAVMLAEDAPQYMEQQRSDPGHNVSSSRQIYLTFPAESTFTEDDVANYFSTYGEVKDVRIPCQHQRMFGFVSFASEEIVRTILGKGNPHYVCGSRVLVKPYKEKAKPLERKYFKRREFLPYNYQFCSPFEIIESRTSVPRGYESPRMLRKQLLEEQERTFAYERKYLDQLNSAQKALANQSNSGCTMDGQKFSEGNNDHVNLPLAESFNYLLTALDIGCTSDEKDGKEEHTDNNNSTQEGQQVDLPQNPFIRPPSSRGSTDY